MEISWITVLGFILSVGYSVPNVMQLIRTFRVRNAFGWNSQLVLAWLVSYISWALYSGIVDEPMLVVANIIGAVTMCTILVFLIKERQVSVRQGVGWALWATIVLVLGVFLLPALLPIMVTVVDIAVMLPQAVSLMKEHNADGMSTSYFGLSVLLDVGWIMYALLVGKPFLATYSYFGLPWSMWVWWRVRKLHKQNVTVS